MGVEFGTLVLGALSAGGAIASGISQKKAAESNARIALQEAARERAISKKEEAQFRRSQSRILASARAARAASGVRIGTGTPLLVDEATLAEIELGAETIRAGGQARAGALETEAELQRRSGRAAQTASFFGAGRSLLAASGFGRG